MEFLSQANCKEILKEWQLDELSFNEQIVKIFERVRDIRFGSISSRNPIDVYKANKGTCSGKHFLIKELYKSIGLKTKDMICMQRWKDLIWFPTDQYQVVRFSKNLIKMLKKYEIIDFHNYLMILINEKWIQIDVTIDKPLKKLGFFTTENWDGKSDMPLCFCGTSKIWDCGDNGMEQKRILVNQLPKKVRDARKEFLEQLTDWIDNLRAKGEI